eukprot:Skav236670  [mRNA]  locus=scaffold338:256965:271234:- [translate_table: standard]
MWKDELSKGIKPNASRKPADADTSSIWSRSTASTRGSRSSEPKPESAEKAFHFGALFGGADAGVEHPDQQESEDVARKRTLSGTNDASDTSGAGATFRSVRRREERQAELSKVEDSEGFITADEDEDEAMTCRRSQAIPGVRLRC